MSKSTRLQKRERVVGSYEAKSKLSQLLEEVDRGATITVTKRGRPVARIVPIRDVERDDAASKWKAWFAVRDARKITTGGMSLRKMLEAGRRF